MQRRRHRIADQRLTIRQDRGHLVARQLHAYAKEAGVWDGGQDGLQLPFLAGHDRTAPAAACALSMKVAWTVATGSSRSRS